MPLFPSASDATTALRRTQENRVASRIGQNNYVPLYTPVSGVGFRIIRPPQARFYYLNPASSNQTGVYTSSPDSGGTPPEPPPPAETWTITSRASGYWPGVASSASGSIVFAAPTVDTIYKSVNAGVTWTPTTSPSDLIWRSIACSSDGSNVIAVAAEGVHKSTNAGSTWSEVTMPVAGSWLSVASSADGSTLIVGGDDTQLYVSSNSGSTWSARGLVRDWLSVASSADGMKLVAAGSGVDDYIYTSSNRGVDWVPRLQVSPGGVASSADGTKLVAIGDTSIYRSTDSGSNWVATSAPTRFWTSITSSEDGSILAAVAQSPTPGVDTLYTSTDSGTTWVARSQVNSWVSIASSTNGSNMVAGSQNGLYTVVYG